MNVPSQLARVLHGRVAAFAGGALLVGGAAAVASPGTTLLEVQATTESQVEDDAEVTAGAEREDADVTRRGVKHEDERSAVAEAVHDALTEGADLAPGDEGFGAAVSRNARERGGNGREVSEAARNANGSAGRGPRPRDPDAADEAAPRDRAPRGRGPADTGPPGHDDSHDAR